MQILGRGRAVQTNSLSSAEARRTCSTLAKPSTFAKSEVLQRSKVNLSFLAVFSAVLVVDADEFSRMKCLAG